MGLPQHALYLACVLAAGYVQNLTGFAFGLVLLGLVGLLHLAPLSEVTNVVSVLTLVNAIGLYRAERPQIERAVMVPLLTASLVGVAAGVLLLAWLSDNVVTGLKLLLGVTILGAVTVLLTQARPRATRSSGAGFAAFGLAAGVLGGLFSTAGPPLVYLMYRQPMAQRSIRDTLVTVFAVNAVLRLALMLGGGRFGTTAWWMSLEAVPLVLLQTHWMTRRPPPWDLRTIKFVVCALLVLVALGLIVPVLRSLF